MDIIGGIVVGIVSGLLSVSIGFIAVRFALVGAKERAKAEINAFVVEDLTGFLKVLHEKPEMFIPVVNGLMSDLQKIIKLPDLNVGGMALGSGGIEAMIPMLPRKFRGPAMLLRMLMGNGGEHKKEQNSSPFG